MTDLARGSVCGWYKVCLVGKGKHAGNRGHGHERPPMNHSESHTGMQKNEQASLSRSAIGQYLTILLASGVKNDHEQREQ